MEMTPEYCRRVLAAAALLRIASEQYALKSDKDQRIEARFIRRDYADHSAAPNHQSTCNTPLVIRD